MIPNTHQQTWSNLTQIKKNKTIEWLDSLPQQKQDEVLDVAYAQRLDALKQRKMEEKKRCELRKGKMLQEHTKLLADKEKKEETLTALSRIDLVTTSEGLYLALESIDDEDVSTTIERTQKRPSY